MGAYVANQVLVTCDKRGERFAVMKALIEQAHAGHTVNAQLL